MDGTYRTDMSAIPDFNDSELWVIRNTLKERYGEDKDLHLADSEIRMRPDDRVLTECPAVYWEAGDAHFVLVKTGLDRFRCQFYYRGYQQYGTGIREFDNIGDCVLTLLRTQADYEAKEKGQ
jgi:hypothetical protein